MRRRTFLAGLAAATGGATVLGGIQPAFGAAPGSHVLVHVLLAGGMDGLSALVPAGDSAYYSARPHISVPQEQLTQLAPGWGLHPGLKALAPLYRNRDLAFVPATGILGRSRSHFAAQDMIRAGASADGDAYDTGWLTRYLHAAGIGGTVAATSMGSAPSGAFRGFPALSMGKLADLDLIAAPAANRASVRSAMRSLYADGWETSATTVLDAIDRLQSVQNRPNGFGTSATAQALTDIATLVNADVGLAAATVEIGGWDTHRDQGPATAGRLRSQLATLADLLTGFVNTLGAGFGRTTIVVQSEFGRRLAENGSRGTDHGHGGLMMVLGQGFGGRIVGTWPGLSPTSLDRGDVATGTDYRDVLADVIAARTGVDPGPVFPGLRRRPVL